MALCGAREWSWISPAAGFALMMLVAVPAIHVPGHATSTAVVLALLIVAGIAHLAVRPAQRPPSAALVAALPVALLLMVPFVALGHAGTLGVSIDNDMGPHLLLAEGYRSQLVAHVTPLLREYPLGPHALVGVLAQMVGLRTDLVFAGVIVAGPILLGWTALARFAQVSWPGRLAAVLVAGIPFLIAAYYAEGSFKEIFEALFALATAMILAGRGPRLGLGRWVPLGIVLAGAVSVYSVQGLVWPGLFVLAWLAIRAVLTAWRAAPRAALRELRGELVPGILAAGVTIVLLAPQIPRIARFVSKGTTNDITKTNLGNLVGPLPGWESLGIWGNHDFRLPATVPFHAGMWSAFALALVIVGALWALRRGQWMLPVAAGIATLVWVYADHSQSPYIAAKALVVASPLLLVLAVMPLVERHSGDPGWWRLAAPVLAVVLVFKVGDSSLQALRAAQVGPVTHLQELRSLRSRIGTGSVLFLGNDDFIRWELAGVHVTPAYINHTPQVPLRAEKAFAFGQALDFDSVSAQTLNAFEWVLTTRDAAGSAPPAQMQLTAQTTNYSLWRRTGTVQPRQTLAEGEEPGAILSCATPAGRALTRRRGVAAIRPPQGGVPVPPLAPGASVTVTLPLTAGRWQLEAPYTGPLPIEVTGPDLRRTVPANLDSPGPRWPLGTIDVAAAGPVYVTLHVGRHWLTPSSDADLPGAVIATLEAPDRVVPLSSACGKAVDWYRLS